MLHEVLRNRILARGSVTGSDPEPKIIPKKFPILVPKKFENFESFQIQI